MLNILMNKKRLYFDHTLDSNLFNHSVNGDSTYWTVSHDRLIYLREMMERNGIEVVVSKDYNGGFYLVEVNGGPEFWNGLHQFGPNTGILDIITGNVVYAMLQKKLKLLVLAWSEGHNFTDECFKKMHDTCNRLNIPADQIVIVQGNILGAREYEIWLNSNPQPKKFSIEHGFRFYDIFFRNDARTVEITSLEKAIKNTNVKMYNSLNRIAKPARNDHFYYLITNQLLDKGIVSGNVDNQKNFYCPKFVNATSEQWYEQISNNFPRSADGMHDLNLGNPADNLSFQVYENSLLSVVCETHFDCNNQIFLSEKSFKPLAAGHPFIILGNAGTLETLRSLGFKTDFPGIDQSYDSNFNHQERFNQVHEQIKTWCSYTPYQRFEFAKKSLEIVNHNFQHYRSLQLNRDGIIGAIEKHG